MAKGVDYVAKVARDLIKARRESGNAEKVSIIVAGSGFCSIFNGMFSPLLIWNRLQWWIQRVVIVLVY